MFTVASLAGCSYYAYTVVQKLEEDIARIQKEIPADTSSVEAMTNQLTAAEEKLEGLLDGIKDEVEKYHKQLTKVSAAWLNHTGTYSDRRCTSMGRTGEVCYNINQSPWKPKRAAC